MKLEQLNFHHLFYFWRVAKVGRLTRAAQELHTSQSALSAQIRQLEERLGEALFAREGRRLVLTDTGQLVLAYAEDIFGISQEMLGRLQGRSEGYTRTCHAARGAHAGCSRISGCTRSREVFRSKAAS